MSFFDLNNLFKKPVRLPQWKLDLCYPEGSLPVDEIHQSWLSTWRSCGMKALLSATERSGGKSSYYMFAGSAFHLALEDAIKAPDRARWLHHSKDPRYWLDLFDRVFLQHPADSYEEMNLPRFAQQLSNNEILYGMYMGEVITYGLLMLESAGFTILDCEVKIVVDIPGGIPYVGTIDLLLWHKDYGKVIGDTKTSGFWQRYFQDKSLTKQSFSDEQIKHHLQLTHYDWMGWRAGMWDNGDVGHYFIFTPANLTKYARGQNKGQMRGAPFFFGSPLAGNVTRYESDLKSWLDLAAAGHFNRMYPGIFGKLDCPRCPYGDVCLNDKAKAGLPDYLRGV